MNKRLVMVEDNNAKALAILQNLHLAFELERDKEVNTLFILQTAIDLLDQSAVIFAKGEIE